MAAATYYPTITGAPSHIYHRHGQALRILALYKKNIFFSSTEFSCLLISRWQSTSSYGDEILHSNRAHWQKWHHTEVCLPQESTLVMCTHPRSLIASTPSRRSNPSSWPSTIRASACTSSAIPMSSLILPYSRHFRVLLSAVSTFTSFCHQRQHTCLLTNVHKQPESTKAMHSYPSTDTLMVGCTVSFIPSGEETDADICSPKLFPWHSDEMCPILLHWKHCIWQWNLHVQLTGWGQST